MRETTPTTGDRIALAHPMIGDDEKAAVMRVMESGQLAQGPVVEEFEEAFARWIGVRHAVAVNSGTAALHLALLAHDIGAGDEVITSPFTFIASANAALYVGARPAFVDVEDTTFCLDATRIEAAITKKTRALLPVHLYGHPSAMAEIGEIARRRNLLVIEDAAQAHGAEVQGRKVGALGYTAVFSLYPTKNMTSGEGGFVTTEDDRIAAAVTSLRQHGESERYHHERLGYNFRMTDLCAAIGLAQLRKVEDFTAARRRNAQVLTEGLAGLPGLVTPTERPGYRHVYHQYTVRLPNDRDGVRKRLAARGVGSGVYYPLPVHEQPVYGKLGYSDSLPVAERLAGEVLSLPVHPALTESDLARIVDAVRAEVPR